MTTYEQLIEEGKQIGLQEGRLIGFEEGSQVGISKVLLRQIAKKFHADASTLAHLIESLTASQQDELTDKVLDASTLEEIVEWLKAIRRN